MNWYGITDVCVYGPLVYRLQIRGRDGQLTSRIPMFQVTRPLLDND